MLPQVFTIVRVDISQAIRYIGSDIASFSVRESEGTEFSYPTVSSSRFDEKNRLWMNFNKSKKSLVNL